MVVSNVRAASFVCTQKKNTSATKYSAFFVCPVQVLTQDFRTRTAGSSPGSVSGRRESERDECSFSEGCHPSFARWLVRLEDYKFHFTAAAACSASCLVCWKNRWLLFCAAGLAVSDIWVDEEIYAISMAICSKLCVCVCQNRVAIFGEWGFFGCSSPELDFFKPTLFASGPQKSFVLVRSRLV